MIINIKIKLEKISRIGAVINAGVSQGTLVCPVCFIVHINDLQTSLPLYKYAVDRTAWEVFSPAAVESHIQ